MAFHPPIGQEGEDLDAACQEFIKNPPARPAATIARIGSPITPVLGSIVERFPNAQAIRPPESSDVDDQARHPSQGQHQEQEQRQQIDLENQGRIKAMNNEEILAAQEELRTTLPPKLFQKWSNKRPL